MPIPLKFTQAQILALYQEYHEQDKDLKTFLEEKGLGEHYQAIAHRFHRIEKRLMKEGSHAPISPKGIVQATVEEAIAKKQRDDVMLTLQIGEACKTAYYRWAAKKGMSVEDMKKMPIHKAVAIALEKESQYDEVMRENAELRAALRLYSQEVDPRLRLKAAINLITDFLEMATVAELVGFNIKDSGLIGFYQQLLEKYLVGE
jgi:hypothetical protein